MNGFRLLRRVCSASSPGSGAIAAGTSCRPRPECLGGWGRLARRSGAAARPAGSGPGRGSVLSDARSERHRTAASAAPPAAAAPAGWRRQDRLKASPSPTTALQAGAGDPLLPALRSRLGTAACSGSCEGAIPAGNADRQAVATVSRPGDRASWRRPAAGSRHQPGDAGDLCAPQLVSSDGTGCRSCRIFWVPELCACPQQHQRLMLPRSVHPRTPRSNESQGIGCGKKDRSPSA